MNHIPSALPSNPEDWTAWIVSQRPHRPSVDPFRPSGFFLENERSASGQVITSACILLTGKECPWRCLMCDLWQHTSPGPTPLGAIPRQIDFALAQLSGVPQQLKLYNAGSFFDTAAIPPADYRAIADRVQAVPHVIVESHPRLVGTRTQAFRDMVSGTLEVALGLETVHPQILPRLNKRVTLDDFARAAGLLDSLNVALRAFVLVQPPFLPVSAAVEWAVKSAEFAFACGASAVSLIPTRPGNGALDRLMQSGEFSLPQIDTLERALDSVLTLNKGRAFVDLWDLARFSKCAACLPDRKRRLETTNLSQKIQPPARCAVCGTGTPSA